MLDALPRMLDDDAEMNGLRVGDGKQIVRFYLRSVVDPEKSKAAGRPVHDPQVWVTIQHPGDKLFKLDIPASTEHQRRFPQAYAFYLSNQESIEVGTPLGMLFPANPEVVDNLRSFGIQTVEHLANVGDGEVGNLGPSARKWRDHAKALITQSEAGAESAGLRRQNEQLQEQMAALQQQMGELLAAKSKPEARPQQKGA